MSGTTTIYVLRDPTTNAARYIGMTRRSLSARLADHLRYARGGDRTHRSCWIRSIALPPVIEAIAVVSNDAACDAEIQKIADYRAAGCDLVNATNGGDGGATMTGRHLSEETKARIRAKRIGFRHTPESIAKMSASKIGFVFTEEHRNKIRAANTGFKHTQEAKNKVGAAKRGKMRTPFSAEWRANLAAASRGRKHTPEARAKIRESNLRRHAARRALAAL